MIQQAFILCAGYGKRMMPLSSDRPKPMVAVNGRPIIDYTLDHLVRTGVRDVVVNLHAHGPVLKEHLKNRSDVTVRFSEEATILDTGGGLQTGYSLLPHPDQPFFAINGDAFWEGDDSLQSLNLQWEQQHTQGDILLMLQDVNRMPLTRAVGDYDMDPETGRAQRNRDRQGEFMFTGVRILHPRCLTRPANTAFSFLDIMDDAEEKGRLLAQNHAGLWHHLSTPDDIDAVEKAGI